MPELCRGNCSREKWVFIDISTSEKMQSAGWQEISDNFRRDVEEG